MALSAFEDKSRAPQPEELKRVLGRSAQLWFDLVAQIESSFPGVTQQWNFAGQKFGWSLRLRQKERVILYMTPQPGSFLAGLVLGDKALRAAREAKLPVSIVKIIDNAPKYAEGTGIRIPVRSRTTAAAVVRLAACKMNGQGRRPSPAPAHSR